MSTRGWRRVAALPLVALAVADVAHAVEAAAGRDAMVAPEPPAVTEPEAGSTWVPVPGFLQAFGVETWWDVVQFGTWSGTIGLTFDDHEQRVTSPRSATQRFGSRLLDETFTVRNDGFAIINPRLLLGNFGLGLTLEQEWQRTLDTTVTQHSTLDNYAFDITALPEQPYNVNMYANESQNTSVLPSGTTTHSDLINRGITLRLREDSILRDKQWLPYFNANVRAYQEFNKATTTTAGQSFHLDDRRDVLAFDFTNGGLNSDLSFLYQFTKYDNFVYEPGSYRSHSTNAIYSIDFGPNLNWRSDSHVNYYSRSGRDPQSDMTNLDFSEFLTIDHNAELSSNYNYQLNRQTTSFGNTTSHALQANVYRQFYHNFSASMGATGLYTDLPGGSIGSAGVNAGVNYSHRLPWEGNLYASGGASYLHTNSHVASGLVQVTDAAYQVPQSVGAGASILLKDRNIQVSSIEVVVLKGGARVPAVVDVDYTVRVDGDRTSIVPQPTSVVMLPGDPLNISYAFLTPPDAQYQTVTNSASLGVDWPWFGFSASHDETDETPLAGSDATLLVSERRDTARVYARALGETWQARAGAGYVRYDSTRLAYNEARLDQYLSYQPRYDFQIALSADQHRTHYTLPTHTTTGTTTRFDLTWTRGAWLTTGYASWRTYHDTEQPSETVIEAGLRVRRTWAKLDLNVSATLYERKRNQVDSLSGLLHIGVVRRF